MGAELTQRRWCLEEAGSSCPGGIVLPWMSPSSTVLHHLVVVGTWVHVASLLVGLLRGLAGPELRRAHHGSAGESWRCEMCPASFASPVGNVQRSDPVGGWGQGREHDGWASWGRRGAGSLPPASKVSQQLWEQESGGGSLSHVVAAPGLSAPQGNCCPAWKWEGRRERGSSRLGRRLRQAGFGDGAGAVCRDKERDPPQVLQLVLLLWVLREKGSRSGGGWAGPREGCPPTPLQLHLL